MRVVGGSFLLIVLVVLGLASNPSMANADKPSPSVTCKRERSRLDKKSFRARYRGKSDRDAMRKCLKKNNKSNVVQPCSTSTQIILTSSDGCLYVKDDNYYSYSKTAQRRRLLKEKLSTLVPPCECQGVTVGQLKSLTRIGGHYAAYAINSEISLIDLRDTQAPTTLDGWAPSGVDVQPISDGSWYKVTAVAVNTLGHAAWIVQSLTTGPTDGINLNDKRLIVHDATGNRMLDSGKEIDEASLTLAGTTVHWNKAGTPKSATLE